MGSSHIGFVEARRGVSFKWAPESVGPRNGYSELGPLNEFESKMDLGIIKRLRVFQRHVELCNLTLVEVAQDGSHVQDREMAAVRDGG